MKLFITREEGEEGNVLAGVVNSIIILSFIAAIIWLLLEWNIL